jgi:asparagine synthase (glutamine-hydrolysing)
MCGIWTLITRSPDIHHINEYNAFKTIAKRGPDRSYFIEHGKPYNVKIGFHRLSIMDPSVKGDQPFVYEIIKNGVERIISIICNGELYNYMDVVHKYNITLKSGSDCEIIGELYVKYGIEKILEEIKGEFAFVIIDMEKESGNMKISASRDPFGIRPLFVYIDNTIVNFCSELKGIIKVYNKNDYDAKCLNAIKPGHFMTMVRENGNFSEPVYNAYYNFPEFENIVEFTQQEISSNELEKIKQKIVELLTDSVKGKLMSDRPIGCLLSGGLDSSLVAAISAKILHTRGKKLQTFSIGMENSTDEKYARMVADHIGSSHTHITLDVETWINTLKDVIYTIESYDKTSVRASTGQLLAAKIINETTDIKVLLVGDGADELCSGYLYFHKAPTPIHAHYENIRLLTDISLYDVKRSDEGIARNGIEARVPFLDVDFVNYYLSINPSLRIPRYSNVTNTILEKWLLREAFSDSKLLPQDVLYRKKEAFSDGVSGTTKSWYQIIQEYVNNLYDDNYLEFAKQSFTHCPPDTKEALYYRECYTFFFGKKCDHIIPYFWLPKWCGNISEPSARVLDVYKSEPNNIKEKVN